MTNTLKNMKGSMRSLLMTSVAALTFTLAPKEAEAGNIRIRHEGQRQPAVQPAPAPRGGGNSSKKISAWDYAKENFEWTAADVGSTIGGVRVGESVGNGLGDLTDIGVGNLVDFVGTGVTKGVQGLKKVFFGTDSQTPTTTPEGLIVERTSNYTFVNDSAPSRKYGRNGNIAIVPDRSRWYR